MVAGLLALATTIATGVEAEFASTLRPRPAVVSGAHCVHEDFSVRGDELTQTGEADPLGVTQTLVRLSLLRGCEVAVLRRFLISHGEREVVPLFGVYDHIPSAPLDDGIFTAHPGNGLANSAQGTEVLLSAKSSLDGLDVQKKISPAHLPLHAPSLPEREEEMSDPLRSVDSLIHRRSLGLGKLRRGVLRARRNGERGHHRHDDGQENTEHIGGHFASISKKKSKVARPQTIR